MIKVLSLMILASCMQFVQMTDDAYFESIDPKTKSENLNLVFSHNINGEMHPCGCRNFPLGGMAQAAGKLYELKKSSPTIYVDSGDAFFMSSVVPDSLRSSQEFTAHSIHNSFNKLGLKLFVPGDQDFALGEDFLTKLSMSSTYSFLSSNLNKNSQIKAKRWHQVNYGKRKIIFVGITHPETVPKFKNLFNEVTKSLKETFKSIKKKGVDLRNATVILLSHSGIDNDKKIAKSFPFISWIIGSHTQSFLKEPITIGSTKIVQVLSRNHYLGYIQIPADVKQRSSYQIIETRDELKNLWKKNPFIKWLEDYKVELEKVQTKEQEKIAQNFSQNTLAPTFNSCTECHEKQVEFWQGTAHSLALVTLHKDKAINNPACIKCHSLNHNKDFTSKKNVIITEKNHDQYWKEFNSIFENTKSVRKISKKKRVKLSKKWVKLDEKFELAHNFGNVQCLNCHDLDYNHPFALDNNPKKETDYKSKCLKCHTTDQSPSWYDKDSKGIAKNLNLKYFNAKLKSVSCPKHE